MANETKQGPKLVQPPQGQSTTQGDKVTAPPVAGRISGTWIEQAEAYLMESGWEKVSEDATGLATWTDPIGAGEKSTTKIAFEIPRKDGGVDRIEQTVGPPLSWDYPTHAAVAIQRERDRHGKAESPLQRLNDLGSRYDKLLLSYNHLVTKLSGLAATPVPEKLDNLRITLGRVKGEISHALQEAQDNLPKAKAAS